MYLDIARFVGVVFGLAVFALGMVFTTMHVRAVHDSSKRSQEPASFWHYAGLVGLGSLETVVAVAAGWYMGVIGAVIAPVLVALVVVAGLCLLLDYASRHGVRTSY